MLMLIPSTYFLRDDVNAGQSLPDELLIDTFNSVVSFPFQPPSQGPVGHLSSLSVRLLLCDGPNPSTELVGVPVTCEACLKQQSNSKTAPMPVSAAPTNATEAAVVRKEVLKHIFVKMIQGPALAAASVALSASEQGSEGVCVAFISSLFSLLSSVHVQHLIPSPSPLPSFRCL
jgi:hypothetical protein